MVFSLKVLCVNIIKRCKKVQVKKGGDKMEVTERHSGKAVASMVLGIIGLIAWFIPLFGMPITIVGLVLGIKGKNSSKKGMAIAGIVMCIIGLVATLINGSIGAYLGATGQL